MQRLRFARWWLLALLAVFAFGGCNMQSPAVTPVPPVATTVPTVAPSPTAAPPTATAAPKPQPQPTTQPPQPVASPTPAGGTITGMVWEDACPPDHPNGERCQDYKGGQKVGDGKYQDDEFVLSGVVVSLAKGGCPGTPVAKAVTDTKGRYRFAEVEPGTYCVAVDTETAPNATLLRPGVWTAPGLDQGMMTVQVTPGTTQTVNFGRTRLAQAIMPPTQVAQATEAAPTAAPMTPSPQPTATAQAPAGPGDLGEPTVHDTLTLPGKHWYLNTTPFVKFAPAPGSGLLMQVTHPDNKNYWLFSTYPVIKDGYIEALFKTGPECRYKDRYGLLVRSPTHYEGVQFLVSCDAFYEIVRWNGGMKVYQFWDRTTAVHPGPGQVNRVGVWMQGKTLRLYINREMVKEIRLDTDLFDEGNFGLIIGAEKTAGFQVTAKEVSYWVFP